MSVHNYDRDGVLICINFASMLGLVQNATPMLPFGSLTNPGSIYRP